MPLPQFLIIGAMKCGTSTLAAQLGQQNGIFISTPKEPNFFSDDEVFGRGMPWYENLFENAELSDICGEASTHYTKLPMYPDTVPRMRQVIKNPKLVYMVRDPVDRAVSHFIHEWTERRMTGDLETAMIRYPELVEYGMFAKQLTPFIEAFGIDSICLTSLERMKSDPAAELDRVARFIGAKEPTAWQETLAAQNVSSQRVRKLPFHSVLVGNSISRTLRRRLIPDSIRAKLAKSRQMAERPTLSPKVESRLRDRFELDQIELADLFPGVLDVGRQKGFT